MGRWFHEKAYDIEVNAAHDKFPAVPTEIIKAVIGVESGFRKDAVRGELRRGDASIGLMQVLLNTARGLGYSGTADGLKVPGVNVYYGTKLLSQNLSATGSWPAAISAYNGGHRPHLGFGKPAQYPVRVCLRWSQTEANKCEQWKDVRPGEFANQDYVNKVMNAAAYFREGEQRRPFPMAAAGMFLPSRPTTGMTLFLLVTVAGLLLASRVRPR